MELTDVKRALWLFSTVDSCIESVDDVVLRSPFLSSVFSHSGLCRNEINAVYNKSSIVSV